MFPTRVFAALLLTAFLAPPIHADENKEITFHVGLMSLNAGKSFPGGAAAGPAYGFRFLHDENDCVSLGLDIDLLKPKDKSIDNLVLNTKTTRSIASSSILGVVRIGQVEGDLRPYGLIGFGIHFTNIRLESKPKAGFGWADTGTTETRTMMDADGSAVAIKIQAGADYAVTDNFLAGGFLAYNNMGGAMYGVTDAGRAQGLAGSSGAMTAITFGLNLTGRF
jgi:opacity protein-like surface antigen